MQENLLSTAEFAELTQTTKRAIQLYDNLDILKPKIRAENGYRYYSPEQIMDYQVIYLLSLMGINLATIKDLFIKQKNLTKIFKQEKPKIEKQLHQIKYALDSTSKYIENIKINKTLVNPSVVHGHPFKIFYIESKAPYSSIRLEIRKLLEILPTKPTNPITLTLQPYKERDLSKSKQHFYTGILQTPELKKIETTDQLKYIEVNSKNYYTYTHTGPQRILSYLWQQMHLLQERKRIKLNKDYQFGIEIYTKSIFNGYQEPFKHETEMLLPIKL